MKQEDIAQIITLLKENREFNEHAVLLARQSTPDSLSPILGGIKADLKRIEEKVDEMKPKIDLIYPKVTGDIRKEEVWGELRRMFNGGSGVVLKVVATVAAIIIILGWGRQVLLHWIKQ